jgi:transposase InsO family protein
MGHKFQDLLSEHGITHIPISSHSPKLNSITEQFNRTALTMVEMYLAKSKVKEELWGKALHTAVHVLNRTHNTTSTPSPFKHWFHKPTSLAHMRVFSCRAFTLNHHDKQSKLHSQAHTHLPETSQQAQPHPSAAAQ